MAPAEGFSAPGVATYDSNTMTVGDGTWDFEKNTFLLPNLQGLNFETMQYNGMGNRFSTVAQYHTLILAHGVMGAIVFLFIVPISILMARFYTAKPGYAIPYHAQLQILGALMLVAVFTLGWFAVGPERSWTNPHHAIGLAIFIMFLLQIIGGRLVRNIKGRSLRKMFHRWSGRLIALLGIIQVPLGLTLYGSPKYTFILYSLWMTFLLLLYFILSYRAEGDDRGRETYISGGRSEGPSGVSYDSEYYSDVRTEKSKGHKWVAPLAAGATIAALFSRKKNKEREKELSRDRSRSRSRSRGPEVIGSRRESVSYLPSRRGSASYFEDEKYTEVDSRRDDKKKGGGFMQSLFGVGAGLGAGKLLSNMMKKKEKNRPHDEEYSAVSTETPRRRPSRNYPAASEFTDYTDWTEDTPPPRRGPRDGSILPPPGNPVMAAQALSAAESRTNRPQNARTRSQYSFEDSEYSSYVSPSRRPEAAPAGPAGGAGKGILAGLGLGWFAKKLADRKNKRAEEQRIREEEDMRSGVTDSRYTGDGFSSPSRDRRSRRASGRPPRPPMSALSTEITELTESSELESRPPGTGYGRGPPMPPFSAGPPPRTPPGAGYPDSVSMPSMPPDPHGILNRGSESDVYGSPSSRPRRRDSSSRRRAGEEAAAAAVASASVLAAKEESRRRTESERMGASPSAPVSVKVRVHDDKDRNVTLRRLTEEEAAASRRDHRRRRGSMSSLSGTDAGGSGRRYRRDSSQRRAEAAAERMAEAGDTLSPPNPAFAAGRKPKDSAYYSGPAGNQPAASATVSSIGSEHTHGTWSQLSPSPAAPAGPNPTGSAAADNRRRRRQERRRSSASQRPTGIDMYD
ncbi:hypothetical protein CkaCkLH20_06932 [Colletotrichum karsti]|uniref:Cytochrome b561 domain-containing protein n=1 Tax=Colletotrichum karsti TaxID=1095194 RepID=A0A9P6LJV0_9PEZI|nr:uncharacterized protein CkaCkLH20_06932 [Colletotrichum karsti]KAF9875551.1 hypothetical protein CkaCkLH20_06932 [Colletotrichum karsti]